MIKFWLKKAYDKIIQNMNRNDKYNQLIFAAYEKVTERGILMNNKEVSEVFGTEF